MELELILKAFAVGLAIALPIGPMALLCIQRTMRYGPVTGVITATGVSLADAVFGLLGILGLSAVSDFLIHYETIFKLAGAVFILALGVKIILDSHHVKKSGVVPEDLGLIRAFTSAFFLTLSNPMTILAYIAIMASLQINVEASSHAWILTMPIFLGSFVWFSILVLMAKLLKNRLNDEHIHRISLFSGGLLIVFSVFIFISAL